MVQEKMIVANKELPACPAETMLTLIRDKRKGVMTL